MVKTFLELDLKEFGNDDDDNTSPIVVNIEEQVFDAVSSLTPGG